MNLSQELLSINDFIDSRIKKQLSSITTDKSLTIKMNDYNNSLEKVFIERYVNLLSNHKTNLEEITFDNLTITEQIKIDLLKFLTNNNTIKYITFTNRPNYDFPDYMNYYSELRKNFMFKTVELFFAKDNFLKLKFEDGYEKEESFNRYICCKSSGLDDLHNKLKTVIMDKKIVGYYIDITKVFTSNNIIIENINIFNKRLISYFNQKVLPPEIIILIFEYICHPLLKIDDQYFDYPRYRNIKEKIIRERRDIIKQAVNLLDFSK